jgi:hypothetical protein
VCAACAMAAMAGASGARSWLQQQHTTWLTPQRMRVATVGLFTAAAIGSSVTISGSTPGPAHGSQSSTGGRAHQPAVPSKR